MKQTHQDSQSSTPQKNPSVPPVFKKPQLTPPFPQGAKIRQDGKMRFFSRTRRGI